MSVPRLDAMLGDADESGVTCRSGRVIHHQKPDNQQTQHMVAIRQSRQTKSTLRF